MSVNIQKTVAISITRSANTTAYSTGQVINNAGSVAMVPVKIEKGDHQKAYITGGQGVDSVSQTTLKFDVLLFSAPFNIAGDGSAFNPTTAQLDANYLGRMSFNAFTNLASNSICDAVTANAYPVIIDASKNSVYAVLVATGSYTPVSGENIQLKLYYETL